MAVIAIDDKNSWVVAKWAVRFVVERISLSEVSQAFAQQITECIDHDLGYLTLEKLSAQDRASFGVQVKRIADDLTQAGPSSLATPSVHSNLVEYIRQLQYLVEGLQTFPGRKEFRDVSKVEDAPFKHRS